MPIIAAICDRCGTVYSFGITLVGPASRAMVGNTTEPCPFCASTGTVPDGLYDIFGDLVRILAPTRSGTSFYRLAPLVRSARYHGMDSEWTATAIETQAPEFAQLATNVRDHKGWSLYQYLTILLLVIEVVIVAKLPAGVTEPEIDQLYDQFVETHPVIASSPEASLASAPIQYRKAMATRRLREATPPT
jgi:hypothetical protein